MKYSSTNHGFPAGNPIANLLVVIAGALTIAISVVIGFFAFVALAGFILVVATVIGIRTWWFNRQAGRRSQGTGSSESANSPSSPVIEGEFRIVDDRKSTDRNS